MSRLLIPAVLTVFLVLGGLVHGLWTDRWNPTADALVAEASSRLDKVPLKVGAWQGTAAQWEEIDIPTISERVVTRQYVNRLNGNAVSVLLACGHSRNLWMFHTPAECYPAHGYALAGSIKTRSIPVEGSSENADFFVADFHLNKESQSRMVRVFWSWSGAGSWQAPEFPRFAFGRYAALDKVYVIREMLKAEEPLDNDPCIGFIGELVPELSRSLFAGS